MDDIKEPQVLLKIICKNPEGCECETWSFIKDCKHSVEEISDSPNLWMIDGEDREG